MRVLPEIPYRLARRPRDRRGYPVPWNVQIGVDGTPLFTVNNVERHMQAIREELCPICGERLGKWRWFVGGPRSAFDPHGAYFDLPGHHDCEQYALQVCPWLSTPRYASLLQEGVLPHRDKVPGHLILTDPTMLSDRPPCFVAVASDRAALLSSGGALPYVRPVRPYLAVEYWKDGQQIPEHRALPVLRGIFGAEWRPPALREER